ncbi:MAG: phosphonate C-P lyase system protein PhnH [Roseiarcus sp.]|uniref:phosphonate C-P lyase system protein PhnH n=1 Tax=Roseiarcus sp. TaxID=1969460 RepID=UPI003C363267
MSALAFADPAFESQAAFRAILRAIASPGAIELCGRGLAPPPPLSPAAAAAILTLADFETPLWIAPSLAEWGEAAAYLKFHTGAPLAASPRDAAFALLDLERDSLDLKSFAQGSPDYPDRSTTVVAETRSLARGPMMRISGPGVRGTAEIEFEPTPGDFLSQWEANHSTFPLGVDLILAHGAEVAVLPRSVRVTGGE